MSQEKLGAGVVRKLISEATIVTLTGHTSKVLRIGMDMPITKKKCPYLGVNILTSIPLLPSDVTHLQTARVQLIAHSTNELVSIQIADEVQRLVNAKTLAANTGFYNFSSTDIDVRMTRYKGRSKSFDEETDVWSSTIEVDVIWTDEIGCT